MKMILQLLIASFILSTSNAYALGSRQDQVGEDGGYSSGNCQANFTYEYFGKDMRGLEQGDAEKIRDRIAALEALSWVGTGNAIFAYITLIYQIAGFVEYGAALYDGMIAAYGYSAASGYGLAAAVVLLAMNYMDLHERQLLEETTYRSINGSTASNANSKEQCISNIRSNAVSFCGSSFDRTQRDLLWTLAANDGLHRADADNFAVSGSYKNEDGTIESFDYKKFNEVIVKRATDADDTVGCQQLETVLIQNYY